MPAYSTATSRSLHKMDYNNNNQGRMGKMQFNMGNVFADPFSLATSGIAIAGWIITFISSIVADVDKPYPNYCWWSIVYMLFVILGVIFAVACDRMQNHQVAIVGFLGAGLVFTTSSVNSLIYSEDGAKEAAAAGFILLSMVAIVWIFYYGSTPTMSQRQTMGSFAMHKEGAPNRTSRHMTQSYRPETTHSSTLAPQMYNSAQLAGFETSSPVSDFPGGPAGGQTREGNAFQQQASTAQQQPSLAQQQHPLPQSQNGMAGATAGGNGVAQAAEYPYRAKAIYSYEANPDDANEISFTKHEILEVSDVSGRWWQAKKSNGDTGIAPSNYLILL